MSQPWAEIQEWERIWWGTCANTYGEETKQLVYAQKMGMRMQHDGKSPYAFDLGGVRVLDIGGGPCSLLLKCSSVRGTMVDPCHYPDWVYRRYDAAGVIWNNAIAESIDLRDFDEAWIYNVLQHVQDPERVVQNARRAVGPKGLVRLFEWVEHGVSDGHPHNLTAEALDEWLGGIGKTEWLNTRDCVGQCYYGIFLGL